MGILFTILMGIPLTITMGILFTIVVGIQFTVSNNTDNDFLMRLIDEQYTRRPTFGVEKMRDWLRNQGHIG